MFGILRGWLASDMAIDLGTANTIIYVDKKGIVLNEPSVVAIEQQGQKKTMRDIGHGAKEMLGRTPGNIVAMRPLKDGVIADFEVTEQMLNAFIKRAHGAKWFTPGPRIIVCVPCSATQVERRAIRESTLNAGATKVYLIEEPMAAAIGCDLPVNEPSGSMVVDIGGGTTEIGIVSLGGLVHGEAIHAGGDKIDEAIIAYVRQQHGIAIGEGTAKKLKSESPWRIRIRIFAKLLSADGMSARAFRARSKLIAAKFWMPSTSRCAKSFRRCAMAWKKPRPNCPATSPHGELCSPAAAP